MHLYDRFKFEVGASLGRHPTDTFSARFENVRRMFRQNFKISNN